MAIHGDREKVLFELSMVVSPRYKYRNCKIMSRPHYCNIEMKEKSSEIKINSEMLKVQTRPSVEEEI